MNMTIKTIVKAINEVEYSIKTLASSSASTIIGVLFFLYNEYIGLFHHVIWCVAIGIYYLFLTITRGMVIKDSIKERQNDKSQDKKYILTHVLLLFVNLSLIGPIAIMILGEKSYTLGLIPAIAMATYTTYRITMSIIHYIKTRKNHNPLIAEIRLINFVDSLVAILTLQNTMIIAVTGEVTSDMKLLSIVSSTGIWIVIMLFTILSFVKTKRMVDEIES